MNIRRIAKENNFKLNEYTLTKNNKILKIESEYDIFKFLNLDYVLPKDR